MRQKLFLPVGLWATVLVFSYYQLVSCSLTRGPCSYNEVQCENKLRCIRSSYVCDGDPDCADGSDEFSCYSYMGASCSGGFKCTSGQCIRLAQVCDGTNHCLRDYSDESNCTCEATEFKCNSTTRHECIPDSTVCDGGWDCTDGSDESPEICQVRGCSEDSFKCKDHRCVPKSYACNDGKDCLDGSDEEWDACPCDKTPHHIFCRCQPGYHIQFSRNGLQFCEDFDECSVNTCDHFCKNFDGSHECSCDEGYVLKSDNKSCAFVGNPPLLLYVWDSFIVASSLNFKSVIPVKVSREVSGFDMDSHSNAIFWTNALEGVVGRKIIRPATGNGLITDAGENEILFRGLQSPTLLAFDWYSNNVFIVTNLTTVTSIMICHVGHKPQKHGCATLYEIGNVTITGIVTAPYHGYIFWTQVSIKGGEDADSLGENVTRTGSLWKGSMDGSRVIELATKMINPAGLVIHHVFERILWIDSGTKSVESMNFDGTNRNLVLQIEDREWGHVHGLAIVENNITWIENGTSFTWKTSGLQQHPSLDSNSTFVNVTTPFLIGARIPKILHPALQPPGNDPCENNFCDFICTPIQRHDNLLNSTETLIDSLPLYKYKCLCPEGFSSEDDNNINCEPENTTSSRIVVTRKKLIILRPSHRNAEDDQSNSQVNETNDSNPFINATYKCNTSETIITTSAVVIAIAIIFAVLAQFIIRRNASGKCDKSKSRTYIELQSDAEGFNVAVPVLRTVDVEVEGDDGDI